jgi:hypothetical protein
MATFAGTGEGGVDRESEGNHISPFGTRMTDPMRDRGTARVRRQRASGRRVRRERMCQRAYFPCSFGYRGRRC